MKNNQNIEDLFRQGVSDYKVSPSDKVWSGINKKLVGPRFDASYKNAFKGFKISPSEQLWRRISAAVWFNKFIHFTPFSFNIYYLGFIMTAVVGTVITINNNPNLEFFHFDQQKTEQIVKNETPEEVVKEENINLNNSETETANLTDLEKDLNNDANIETSQNVNNLNTNLSLNSNNLNPATGYQKNNQNQTMADVNENSSGDAKIIGTEPELTTNKTTAQHSESQKSEIIESRNSHGLEIISAKLLRNLNFRLSYKPIWSEYAENAFKSAPKRDQIIYDTIGYNYLGQPVVVEKSWIAIDISYTPYIFNYSSELLNQELQSNYNFYTDNNKPRYSFSTGLGLSFNYNRFNVESGVYYHKYTQSISQLIKEYNPITSSYFDYFENEYWNRDTTMILDLDEYLNGNIVYIPYIDSTLLHYEDSTEIFYADSVLIDKLLSGANSYHIIDVPIVAGYELRYNRFTVTPKAGLITSFVVKRLGNSYNIADGTIISADLLPNNKIVFDYYTAINLKFDINKHFSVFVEPHIRGDINSIYPTSYIISEKSRKFGVKTGISYKF